MAHPKYGDRYECFQCGTKFYTMGRPEPLCPKCGANQKKAPKKPSVKATKSLVPADEFENEEDVTGENISDFPIKDADEEAFDPGSDHLEINGVEDEDF